MEKVFHVTSKSTPLEEHGWKVSVKSGLLDFDWCEGKVMPNELIDVTVTDIEENTELDANEIEEQEEHAEEIISESLFDEIYESEESDDHDDSL